MRRFECAVALTPVELRDFLPEPLNADLRSLAVGVRTININGSFRAALAAAAPEVLVAGWSTPLLPDSLPPSLRYVCYLAGSVKNLVQRRHLENGLLVTNWGGSISRTVAEGALWHILSGLRRGTQWTLAMHHDRAWKSGDPETASLFGRRVGIHGFGNVARELIALLRPFGCTITICAPDLDADTARQFKVVRADSLEPLFAANDVVVEAAPLNAATRGCVTAALLGRLRPGSVFVNVGRGAVVDEAALVEIARRGEVYFGLDVFATEPLPADSPLRGLRNVSLTPHLAGPTSDRRPDAGAFAVANLRAYAEGRPLQAVITPEIYDAST